MWFSSVFTFKNCILYMKHFFTGYVHGLNRIWFLGDEFCDKTYHQYFKGNEKSQCNTYTFTKYEVRDFISSQYKSNIRSLLGRLVNSLYKGLNKHSALPRLIVVILDDDLVSSIDYRKSDCDETLHKLTSWLMREFAKAIRATKDVLPEKAKSEHLPHILWMAPQLHKYFGDFNNEQRFMQSDSLHEIVKTMQDMSMLKLVKAWDKEESHFFIRDAYRFTSAGLEAYWQLIDCAIKFWDTVLSKKFTNKKPHLQQRKQSHKNDKFHWSYHNKLFYGRRGHNSVEQSARQRRMPTPP